VGAYEDCGTSGHGDAEEDKPFRPQPNQRCSAMIENEAAAAMATEFQERRLSSAAATATWRPGRSLGRSEGRLTRQ